MEVLDLISEDGRRLGRYNEETKGGRASEEVRGEKGRERIMRERGMRRKKEQKDKEQDGSLRISGLISSAADRERGHTLHLLPLLHHLSLHSELLPSPPVSSSLPLLSPSRPHLSSPSFTSSRLLFPPFISISSPSSPIT